MGMLQLFKAFNFRNLEFGYLPDNLWERTSEFIGKLYELVILKINIGIRIRYVKKIKFFAHASLLSCLSFVE